MDTLEERNLNRLRNGKMMLAYGKKKKSFGLALLLTIIGGWVGAHRFYLGHRWIGLAFLTASIIIFLGLGIAKGDAESVAVKIALSVNFCLVTVLLIELLLSFWVVGRENDRIKKRLAEEYDVHDFKVSK